MTDNPAESPMKPRDEELGVRNPPEPLDYLYWAMVDEGLIARTSE